MSGLGVSGSLGAAAEQEGLAGDTFKAEAEQEGLAACCADTNCLWQ